MAGTGVGYDALNWGRVSRFLQSIGIAPDTLPIVQRIGKYGETVAELLSAKPDKIVDEGSYFLTRNITTGVAGSGIATTAAGSSFADTLPYIVVTNNNPVGGRTIYLDFIKLMTWTAGTNGTNLLYATKIDQGLRYTTGGYAGYGAVNPAAPTQVLTGPNNYNMNAPNNSSALVYAGAITVSASTSGARLLESGICRTAITVVADQYIWVFGGCEAMLDGVLVSGTNAAQRCIPHAAVAIAPGHTFLFHLWAASQTVAAVYDVMIAHRER
jgi:hypothetical protein